MFCQKNNSSAFNFFAALFKRSPRYEDFEKLAFIEKGAYGEVYQVKNKINGEILAMKIINKPKTKQGKEYVKEEKLILKTVKSPFLCEMVCSLKTDQSYCFVLEFLPGGDLLSLLQKVNNFTEFTARFYLAEITLALEHLHQKKIVYRDLKLNNVMLDGNGHIKLIDFGLSKMLKTGEKTNTFCGTLSYLAPEIIKGKNYDYSVDLWSLGILMYDMLDGGPPFESNDKTEQMELIVQGRYTSPEGLSENGKKLLSGLLSVKRHKRWTISKVKESKFFRTIDWDILVAGGYEPPFNPCSDLFS